MSRMETTPEKISDKVIKLCNMVSANSTPIYVPVSPDKNALMNECFPNVDRVVAKNGGKRVNGWSIWKFANILVEAEAHAVWEDENGNLIDVTPHDGNERQILFLPDNSLIYEEKKIDNIRIPLTDSPLVKEYIKLSEERFSILKPYKPHERIYRENLPDRYFQICDRLSDLSMIFHTKVERNDKCPCGSGLKYKKCCGK